jgi:hypothetical protein
VIELLAACVIGAAVAWAAVHVASAVRAAGDHTMQARQLQLLQLFGPAIATVKTDPRGLLVWQPLAKTARSLFPTEFAALDRAAGATFPFTREQIEAAHSAWTADWLAWEQHHDAEYKLKAAQAEHDSAALGPSTLARARIESVEREKLELYHRRYQDYVRTAKALQALDV